MIIAAGDAAETASPALITVRFQAEGWHCWPEAPEHRAYLRAKHRHLFHVGVTVPVQHDDRDIEFHDLKDEALDLFLEQGERTMEVPGRDFGRRSCEMLARHVAEVLAGRYRRPVTVRVSEDGEFEATVDAGA